MAIDDLGEMDVTLNGLIVGNTNDITALDIRVSKNEDDIMTIEGNINDLGDDVVDLEDAALIESYFDTNDAIMQFERD